MQKSTHTNQSSIFLSTPSARRATLAELNALLDMDISIHALREEGDLSTRILASSVMISIHALREEGDCRGNSPATRTRNFYPRPPRGGRPKSWSRQSPQSNFYPRPPRGGRPRLLARLPVLLRTISIHALREEGDNSGTMLRTMLCDFYPRPPRGGRLRERDTKLCRFVISIHALREEGDFL